MIDDFTKVNDLQKSLLKTQEHTIEQKSYSKHSFNRLMRLRVDGVAYGCEIPVLQYDLDKPEKKRLPFIIVGSVSLIVLLVSFCFLTYFAVKSVIPMFNELIGATNADLSQTQISLYTLGFSDFFGLTSKVAVWVFISLIVSLGVFIIGYMTYFVVAFFSLVNCSIQEMYESDALHSITLNVIILLVLSTVLSGGLTYALVKAPSVEFKAILLVSASYFLLAYFVIIIVTIFLQRKKAKQEFAKLPQAEQNDYIVHEREISRVRRYLRRARHGEEVQRRFANKKGIHRFLSFISRAIDFGLLYRNLKNSDFARAKTTLLGRKAFGFNLLFALATAIVVLTLYWIKTSLISYKICQKKNL